jgi:uncharacterized protein YjdB
MLKDTFGSQGRYVRITITGLPDAATKASIADVKLIGLPIIGTAPVTGISLNQTEIHMNVLDASVALEATVAPTNAANTSVVWSSSDPSIAMVDENGVVTPKGAGSATITVTTVEGGFTAYVAVTVTGESSLVKIPQSQMTATASSYEPGDDPSNALDNDPDTWWHVKWFGVDPLPQSIMLDLGGTHTISKLDYMPRPDGGNGTITAYNVYVSQDGVQFTKVATGLWPKSPSVKEVNFVPVRAGYVKLEATAGSGGFASAAELNVYEQVNAPALQAVVFDAASYEVKEGQSKAVKVTAQYSDGSQQDVTAQSAFEIANSSFATIANGTITGLAHGETVINATYGGKQATATIVVKTVHGVSSTALTGSSSVQSGQPIVITYGLNGVAQQVYAEDISLTYDPTVMTFTSAEPILSNTSIVQKVNDGAGNLRLIVANQGAGHAVTGNVQLLKVTFTSKFSSEVHTTTIAVTDTTLGDEQGNESKAVNSSISVQITPIPPVGIPGDLNHDGKVSIGDLGILAANYGKTSTSSDWESIKNLDSNHDGKIDITDLAFIAQKIME